MLLKTTCEKRRPWSGASALPQTHRRSDGFVCDFQQPETGRCGFITRVFKISTITTMTAIYLPILMN